MPLFRIAWVTSCLSILLAYSQSLLKLPNYFSTADAHSLEMSLASTAATSPAIPSAITGLQASFTKAVERSLAFNGNPSTSHTLPLDSLTCNPLTEAQKNEIAVAAPITRPEAPTASPPQNVSQRLGQFVQNLLARGRKPSEVAVREATASAIEVTVKPVFLRPTNLGLEWGDPAPRAVPVSTAAFETEREAATDPEQVFQVRVNGRAIAQLNEQKPANAIAQHLKKAFSQPDFEAKNIKPALSGDKPVAMMG